MGTAERSNFNILAGGPALKRDRLAPVLTKAEDVARKRCAESGILERWDRELLKNGMHFAFPRDELRLYMHSWVTSLEGRRMEKNYTLTPISQENFPRCIISLNAINPDTMQA